MTQPSISTKNKKKINIRDWLRSPSSKCAGLILAAFVIVFGIYLCVCTPRKYNLHVGSIAHVTIDATKDVEDKVSTEERRIEAAEKVTPNYLFEQDVKNEVLASLDSVFQELRTVQQFGLTLRPAESDGKRAPIRPFSEEEIEYAHTLINTVDLDRTQLATLLRIDTAAFEDMVNTVTVAVDNQLNLKIHEGQVSQSIALIQQIVGYKLDISLTQNIIPTVLRTCVKPNFVIDQEKTEEARQKAMDAVEPVIYLQGQNIIREGDRITRNQIEMLRSLGLLNDNNYDYSVYGGALIVTILSMIVLLMLLRLLLKPVFSDVRKLSVILIILIICFGFASLSTLLPSLYIMPIALGTILGTVLIGYRAGLVLCMPLSILFAGITISVSSTSFCDVVLIMVNTLVSGIATIWFLKGRPQRVRVLIAGIIAAVFVPAVIFGIKLLSSVETLDLAQTCTWAVAGCILSGVLAIALQPVFESLFHLATPSRLLEITNPNHPLMKRLMLEATGTYHHSIIVANLAEAAADKIGANALLARAGAYYHDVGKLKRPGYFSENQRGSNPHEKTDPYVSAAILTSHPKDGALIAQKEHLPPEIIDIILQHHGVTPVMFFYHKALQLADGKHVDINDFRYSGPKPQTKEASIVMLADTIEAAVRSMKDPTPKSIDQFIERLIRGKLEDGQLSDCELSLRDIDQICEAFSDILKGVYHERVEYPKVQQFAVKTAEKADTVQGHSQEDRKDNPSGNAAADESGSAAETAAEPGETETVEKEPAASEAKEKGETDNAD